jgi:ubiquinone/menaquinone biosynthesis C-methylase UbiE
MDELAAMKERQTEVWSDGDYRPVGRMLAAGAGALVEAAGVGADQRVLDVGVGSGSVAVAAAARGAEVVGIDITDAWFEEAHRQAAEQGVSIELRLGDAEALEESADSFDVVLSSFAMVFAPRHQHVAHEVARVCRPGGTIGYTAWQPSLATNALVSFLPPGPVFAGDPNLWADPSHVAALFEGISVTWEFEQRSLAVAFPSIAALEDFVFTNSGPMLAAREALQQVGTWDEAKAALRRAFEADNQATDGSYRADWPYLLGVARMADQ